MKDVETDFVMAKNTPDVIRQDHPIPEYLDHTYHWAYLSRRWLGWLDRQGVVSAILWGQDCQLMARCLGEFRQGERVLQAACVYGEFSLHLAERLGPSGELLVVDVADLQLDNLRHKLPAGVPVTLYQADLTRIDDSMLPNELDGVCCFFLLHEVPAELRPRLVDQLLAHVKIGGKVVFTDYHRPQPWHPLRPVMAAVFAWLEPYAPSLLGQDISSLSPRGDDFVWRKTTHFGGLYQQLVGIRRR